MMSARSIFAIACSFLAFNVFACAKGSTGGFGGGGGEGGDDWGGPGPGSSSSSSGSGGGGGGGGVGGGSGTCDSSGLCSDCAECAATTGSCVGVYNTCNNNTECVGLSLCLGDCTSGDTVCVDNCASTYAAGVDDFIAYQDCVICTDCPIDCEATVEECP